MKNPDEAIDKMLTALASSEVPDGMEQRILRALQDTAITRPCSMRQWINDLWHMPHTRPQAISLASAAIVVCLLSVAWLIPSHPRPETHPGKNVAPMEPSSPFVPSTTTANPLPHPRMRPLRAASTPTPRAMHKRFAEALVNQPAPPMPLTDQEKLLLRIAHRRDPEVIALLTPEALVRQAEQSEAEFQQFFEPSATGKTQQEGLAR